MSSEILMQNGVFILLLVFLGALIYVVKDLKGKLVDSECQKHILTGELNDEKNNLSKLLSQKKSSETRLGQITEHIVPFLSQCPYDPKDMVFLGQPLDYIVFDQDQGEITFLEIKTGNSRASKKQRLLKNIINSGNVYYREMRISDKGVTMKKSRNKK